GVVTQRHEAMTQDAVPRDPADGDAHAAARVAIQPRLRAIGLVAHQDGAERRGVETQLLRHATERRERVAQLHGFGLPAELHADGRHVAVHDGHAMARGAHRKLGGPYARVPPLDPTQALESLAFVLLFFIRDVRYFSSVYVPRCHTRIPAA